MNHAVVLVLMLCLFPFVGGSLPTITDQTQESAVVTGIAVIGKAVTTDKIEISGEQFNAIAKSAAEGKTFLIVQVSLQLSQEKTPVFFDQIALVNAKGEKVPPAYLTLDFDFKKLKTDFPFMPAGQGRGEFYRRDETAPADENVLKSAFSYVVQRGTDGSPDRYGLLYAPVKESTVFVFEIDKKSAYTQIVIADKSAKLKK